MQINLFYVKAVYVTGQNDCQTEIKNVIPDDL